MNSKQSLSVLIADDEAMVNHALQSQVTRLGHRVLGAAYNVDETVELVKQLKPDVVILDMKMPDPQTSLEDPEAGLKAALAIRETCPTAIVLLTAYESPELVEKARKVGIGAYLIKPSKDNEVDRAIAIATARFQDLQELRRSNRTLSAAMEELQQREALFRILSESSPIIIFRAESNGALSYLSPQWTEFSGYSLEEGLANGLEGFAHPEEVHPILTSYQEAMNQGVNWLHNHRFLTKQGAVKWVRLLAAPMQKRDGTFAGSVGVIEDVTRQRRAGELRERAEKRESLGIMAGGIAHDFNNLLSSIQGNLDLLKFHIPEDSHQSRYLSHAEESITRAADLARLMLAFAGRTTLAMEPLDLNMLVQNLKQTMSQGEFKNVKVHFRVEENLPLIEGDQGQVLQAFQALVVNALEACETNKGTITLTIHRQHLEQSAISSFFAEQELEPGEYVAVTVQDTGCGMDAATLERIFDPFFTTKFMGRGLGLAAALGIIQAHQAGLQVQSVPGQGSTFTIFFSPSKRFIRGPVHTPEFTEAGPTEARTILLVDDEEALRETVGELLVILGYHVIYAVDGQDGVEKFAAHPGSIDLVIMDLTMPRMDGYEAFIAIRELDPTIKVVLSSGYGQQDATSRFGEASLTAFLHKPYSMKDLTSVLSQALN